MKANPKPIGPLVAAALATLVLAGCTSTAIDQNFADAQQLSRERLGGELKWLTTDEARHQAQSDADAMLAKPLDGDTAVRIALAYSPSLQAMQRRLGHTVGAPAQSRFRVRAPGARRRRPARARADSHAELLGARSPAASRTLAARRSPAASEQAVAGDERRPGSHAGAPGVGHSGCGTAGAAVRAASEGDRRRKCRAGAPHAGGGQLQQAAARPRTGLRGGCGRATRACRAGRQEQPGRACPRAWPE